MNATQLLMDKVETPIGSMILLARDGVLLLLEFEEAGDRVDARARWPGSGNASSCLPKIPSD